MKNLLATTTINKQFGVVILIGLMAGGTNASQFMVTRDPVITWCQYYDGANRCFSTPGALFSAWNDYYMNEQAKTPNANCVRYNSNFRGQTLPLLNGSPSTFVYDMTEVCKIPSSSKTTVGVGFSINYNAYCGSWTNSFHSWGGGISSAFCYKYIDVTEPPQNGSCPRGNPVYPDSGLKIQNELDYSSADGVLRFERRYRSDLGIFVSHVRGPVFDAANWSGRALLIGPDGKISAFRSSSTNAFTPDANGLDRVTQIGSRWWIYRGSNVLEEYAASGGLLSQTYPDGKRIKFTRIETAVDGPYPFTFGKTTAQADQFDRALGFQYNEHDRLSVLTDPDGHQYSYEHDTSDPTCSTGVCDRMTKVTYPDGFARQYLYNEASYTSGANLPEALTGINEISPSTGSISGQTVRVGTYTYDGGGKAIQTERANGLDRYSFALQMSSSNGSVIVTDPLDTKRTITLTALLGANYPTAESQPEGSGCQASSSKSTYDNNNGNVLSKDDFNGHRTCFAYTTSADGLANMEKVRIEGLPNTASCSSVLAAASLPASTETAKDGVTQIKTQSRKISTQWHPTWALKTKQAEPNLLTTWVYNGQPDPFNDNQTASCVTNTYGGPATLPDNSPITVLCRKVEQRTGDDTGALGFGATEDTSDGSATTFRQWKYSYTEYGQVLTSKGPMSLDEVSTPGQLVTYTYYPDTSFSGTVPNEVGYTKGDLKSMSIKVSDTSSLVTNYLQYDRSGHLLQMRDANDLLTTMSYAQRGWLTSVNQGGLLTKYEYWPTGLLKKATQPDGSYLYYKYDDAHRLTDVGDKVDTDGNFTGNRVHYTLDNAGNRTSEEVKDSGGNLTRNITRTYDALNRLKTVTGQAQ